jgi:hypothetical protein
VAPILNAEEKRRLIGNDIAILFFLDEPDTSVKFSVSGIDSFGEVPQVYAVVQPCGNTGSFRYFILLQIFPVSLHKILSRILIILGLDFFRRIILMFITLVLLMALSMTVPRKQ